MSIEELARKNFEALSRNSYPGRGIVVGLSSDGSAMLQVYWIMGRSSNSRNRVFSVHGEEMRTKAFDESKLEDPSLIIYWPMRVVGRAHVVTNGDQTDTIADAMREGGEFDQALAKRAFEPDAPNFTPRISAVVDLDDANAYRLSILKAADPEGNSCNRQFFHYEQARRGVGHFISTYQGDGNPLPSFAGEPLPMPLPATAEEAAELYWNALDAGNRVSLAVKSIPLDGGPSKIVVVNANSK